MEPPKRGGSMTIFASGQEISRRLRCGRFWLGIPFAVIFGHFLGAVSSAAALTLTVPFIAPSPTQDATLLHLSMMLFVGTAVLMQPITLLTLPLTVILAAVLTTGRVATMLLGAITGLLVGWPLAIAFYPQLPVLVLAIAAAVAGAMFSLSVWEWCIKIYLPAGG
jgi:hypothetical protein